MILHTVCSTLAREPGCDEEQAFLDEAQRRKTEVAAFQEVAALQELDVVLLEG